MDVNTLKTTTQKVIAQRNIFLVLTVLSSTAAVLLAALLFTKQERVVILPTQGAELWIEDRRVSGTYLEKMGVYLSDLLLNRTPSDIDQKNRLILEHAHPAFYHEIKKQLKQERESLVKSQQTFFFRAERNFANSQLQTFTMEGELLVFIGKTGERPSCAQHERKRFIFGFETQGGKLMLKSLKKEEI